MKTAIQLGGYAPPRPLRPGEIFDVGTGRFIQSMADATGTTRKMALETLQCMNCRQFIEIGTEYEEDFVLVCIKCVESFRTQKLDEPWSAQATRLVSALFHPVKLAWRRFRHAEPELPMPFRVAKLTPVDLIRIQPDVREYCQQLTRQGPPWTTLAGLLRELNTLALMTPEFLERIEQIREDLTEASSRLRDPIDFSSKNDQQLIYEARSYVASARNKVMRARHVISNL